jgi:hypothetical protein
MSLQQQIKYYLVQRGLYQPLNIIRTTLNTIDWVDSGCTQVAPHSIKMQVVRSYIKKYCLSEFVETGTYVGETLANIASDKNVQCTSIELSQELYEQACKRFRDYKNVKLVQGDSGQKLPELLKEIDKPNLFWLDGHYSAGVTAGQDINTPINTELQAILNHPIQKHVILIDDARCFNGADNYPHLDELIKKVRENNTYSVEISTDIIRLTPRVV